MAPHGFGVWLKTKCSIFRPQHALNVHKFSDSEVFPFNPSQDSTNPVQQTETAAAGEAGVRSGGGQDQKGNVNVTDCEVLLAVNRDVCFYLPVCCL